MSAAYPPSWADRLLARIRRLPGPTWLCYVVAWAVLFAVETAIKWRDGAYPVGTLYPFHAAFTGFGIYALALMGYLNHAARNALDEFRPALISDGETYDTLLYQLTTLPARRALLASLLGAAWAVFNIAITPGSRDLLKLATSPLSAGMDFVLFVVQWWIWGALIYHTVHQLRLVNRIYTKHTRIDLFNLGPLYAFSGLTARTALGWLALNYVWSATAPATLAQPLTLAITLGLSLIAAVTFAWPLLGIHRLLLREKGRLQGETAKRMQAAIGDLHGRLDSGALGDMAALNQAMASLVIEQTTLAAIPTWPWRPETLRTLITAILIPMAIWLVQQALTRYVKF